MRRAILFCAALVLALACGENITEPVPTRSLDNPLVSFATSTSDDGLSITTDKDDYAPGDTVWFTGAGWPADDMLDILLEDEPATHEPHTWTIDVGPDGTFRDSTYVVDVEDLGVTFTLTATSRATGRTLTVTFTDANSEIHVFSITPSPVAPGGNLTWSASARCTGPGSGANSCSNHGSSVNGPVPNGYTINLLRANGACGTLGQVFAQVASATTSAGTAGGMTTAPLAAGFYAYRTEHPQQNIGGNNWSAVGQGNTPCVTIEVQAANQPPTVDAGGPYSGDEGSAISITGTASDPDGDAVATTWSVDDGGYGTTICTIADPSSLSTTVTCTDNGIFTLTLSGSDGKIATPVTSTATLTVANVAPEVDISAPVDMTLHQLVSGLSIPISANFTDQGSNDTHTCKVEVTKYEVTSVLSSNITDNGADGSCTATLYPSEAAVHYIKVTIKDDDYGEGFDQVMIIVYDPTAGFVTGGGWIPSPWGAYPANPELTGKATFGFVAKYIFKKDKTTPEATGNTDFVFHAADFNFHSSTYDWLLVNGSGTRAQFKGYGAVNGQSGYGFMLTALDGSPDQFRIKIWDTSTDMIVYDNQLGASDDGSAATALGGGSIIIHVKK